jgi:hypothetical protein
MFAAFTDGSKVHIEMALVASATGMVPIRRGMLGPHVKHVTEVGTVFDLPSLRRPEVVGYCAQARTSPGIGRPHPYGQIDTRPRRSLARDQLITWDDIDLPESRHLDAWHAQQRPIDSMSPGAAALASHSETSVPRRSSCAWKSAAAASDGSVNHIGQDLGDPRLTDLDGEFETPREAERSGESDGQRFHERGLQQHEPEGILLEHAQIPRPRVGDARDIAPVDVEVHEREVVRASLLGNRRS